MRVFQNLILASLCVLWPVGAEVCYAQSKTKAQLTTDAATLAPDASRDWGLSGKWTYRSYRNEPDMLVGDGPGSAERALKLLFGEGVMTLNVSGKNVSGTFDMGNNFVLKLTGSVKVSKNIITITLRGPGIDNSPTAGWEYDYSGYLTTRWKNGVDQMPAIVGTVIRAKPHGSAPAGYTASFIAVKQP